MKIGYSLRRKDGYSERGHTTDTSTSLIYASVVSQESYTIEPHIAALNDLELLACDIKNEYLTIECREEIYTIIGNKFG